MRAGHPSIYYGWWVLGAGAVTEMLALGSTSYAAGLFALPLESELGLSRTGTSLIGAIAFSGAALMSPMIGYLLDRVSVPRTLALGAFLLALGFTIISFSSSIWAVMVPALFFLVGFGGMALGPLTTSTLTSRWFYKRRGRALGIASVATSGGGLIVVPLLAVAIDAYGWRTALVIESVVIVAIVWCLCVFVIASGPADLGLQDHPENEGRPSSDMPLADGAERKGGPATWRYFDVFLTTNFWAVAYVIASISGVAQAIVFHVQPYAVTVGYTRPAAAALVSGFAICAAVMKILAGILAEHVDRRLIMVAGTLFMSAALGMLPAFTSYPALFLACCLAGTGLGCILPTSAALIAATFGSPSFGKVMGLVYVPILLGSILFPLVVGIMYDRFRNYDAAFTVLLAVALAGILAAALIRIPKKPAEETAAA